jgi:hypothetical protein
LKATTCAWITAILRYKAGVLFMSSVYAQAFHDARFVTGTMHAMIQHYCTYASAAYHDAARLAPHSQHQISMSSDAVATNTMHADGLLRLFCVFCLFVDNSLVMLSSTGLSGAASTMLVRAH